MHLFLEGDFGVGKTTMLLERVQAFSGKICGFVSVRLVDDAGETVGFGLEDIRRAKASIQREEDCTIPPGRRFFTGDRLHRRLRLEAFDAIESFLDGYQEADLLVLDELGGVELELPAVRKKLYEVLASGIPCIGTIKSVKNHQQMQRHLTRSLQEEEALHLRSWLKSQPNSEILTCTRENRAEIQEKLECFFKLWNETNTTTN